MKSVPLPGCACLTSALGPAARIMCCLTPLGPGRTGPALPRGHPSDGTRRPRGQVRGWDSAGCASPPRGDPRCVPGTEPEGASPAGLSSPAEPGVALGSFPERSRVEQPARLGSDPQVLTAGPLPHPGVPPKARHWPDPPQRVPEDGNIASRGPAGGSIPGWPAARARRAEPSPSETHSGTVAAIADAPAGRRPHHSPAEREPHVHMGRNSPRPKRLELLIGDQP